MSFYTNTNDGVNWPTEVTEFANGKAAAIAGAVRKNGSGYLIHCADEIERTFWHGEWRPASPDETEGIKTGQERLAEAVAYFTDESMDWDAYADTVCTCNPLTVSACPACLDAIEAMYGDEIPY